MGIEWITLLAGAAVSGLTGPVLKDIDEAVRGKIRGALGKDGPLARPLAAAYEDACEAFVENLRSGPQSEADIRVLMEDEAFLGALHQLPFVPFHRIDVDASRRQFAALGVLGEGEDFDAAWRLLRRRFFLKAAETPALHGFLELSTATAQQEQVDRLADLLEGLARKSRARGPRDDDAVLREYRKNLFERYRYADTRGLFLREKEGAGEGIQLQDVFVETPIQRIVEPKRKRKRDDERDEEDERDERFERDEPYAETLPIGQVLGRERLTVVLGEPGSGKSTLMRCLAMALCRPPEERPLDPGLPEETVPVLFELKVFASALVEQPNRQLDRFLFDRRDEELPPIEKLLDEGKALVLLDGLDEVFDESHRRWVSDEVWRLVTRFPRARFVLTSRPHGYEAAPLPGPAARWRLQPFDDGGIRRFFQAWFTALAREGVEAGARESPRERADALTEDVVERPRIREMAQNPMLCTLIVLVHRSRSGRLPERRFVFYEAAVRTLVEFWERAKHSPLQKEPYDFPEPDLMLHALAEVAWRAFHELERREIPGDKLREWLREGLADDPEWTGKRGRKAVEDFLTVVRERTGLLLDLGAERYQFVHLSLHEYLVAHYVLDRLDEERSSRVVRHYLHAPQWEEVLRLTVAGAGQARAEGLVRAVLAEPSSDWEDQLWRDLRFVGRCLGDKASVGSEVRTEVERRLVMALDSSATLDWTGLAGDAVGAACDEVSLSVVLRLADRDVDVRRAAVEYFAKIGADDETTRAAFEKHLADDSWRVRSAAVEYFAKIGADDETTRFAVEKRLADDSWRVRRAAIEYFSVIGADDEATCAAFKKRLADDDVDVRRAAVEYFAKIGADDETTRAAFGKRLADVSMRRAAVEYFARIGADDETIRAAFEKRLTDPDTYVRSAAVGYFAKIGADPSRAAFEKRLTDDDWSVRCDAIYYFARIGADDEATRTAIEKRLADDHEIVRRDSVDYFAMIGADDKATRTAIEKHLADDSWSLRLAAVEYFARIGADDEATRVAFGKRLADGDRSVRRAAAEYFAKIGAGDEATRVAFGKRLADDDWRVRRAAAEYFARTGACDDTTLTAVEERLADNDMHVRRAAVEYFAKIGADDETTRTAFEKRLTDDSGIVRRVAVEYFVETGFSLSIAEPALDAFVKSGGTSRADKDREFSKAFGKIAPSRPELLARLLEEGPGIKYFHMDDALSAAALELDRQRRRLEPLDV